MITKIKTITKDCEFKPFYEKFIEDQMKSLIEITVNEPKENFEKEIDKLFPIQIFNKRIEVFNLPIKFTGKAKLLSLVYTEGNPGKMMALLIDCLQKYDGEVIDIDKLVEIYPEGFYTQESFIDYVDNYIKTRKVAWSEIY